MKKHLFVSIFLSMGLLVSAQSFATEPTATPVSQPTTDEMSAFMSSAFRSALTQTGQKAELPRADTTAYRSSSDVSKVIQEGFVEVMLKNVPPGKTDEARKVFQQTDVIASLRPAIESKGLEFSSMTSAMTAWIILSFEAIHGKETTEAQDLIVWNQLNKTLSELVKSHNMSDKEKQFIAETYYWLTFFVVANHQQAMKDGPAALARSKNMAAELLRSRKIDPDSFTITDQGLTRIN